MDLLEVRIKLGLEKNIWLGNYCNSYQCILDHHFKNFMEVNMDPKIMREKIALAIIEFYVEYGGDLGNEVRIAGMAEKIASFLEKTFPAWDGGN